MMKRQHSEGDVFAIPPLWRQPRWFEEAINTSDPFFSSSPEDIGVLDLSSRAGASSFKNPQELHQNETHLPKLCQPCSDEAGFFKLPNFERSNADIPAPGPDASAIQKSDEQATAGLESGDRPEFWMELEMPEAEPPRYKTWDGFMSGKHSTTASLYLSEAGPEAYDALLNWETDPLGLENTSVPLVETKAYLTSLLSLAAGRESVFFVKSPDARIFKPVLPRLRLSGYSFNSINGVEKECMTCGETFLGLRVFIHASYAKNAGCCRVALSSALSRILQVLQQQLDVEFHSSQSLLRLRATISKVSNILQPLRKLVHEAAQAKTDEHVLSVVFKHACIMECKEAFVREILHEILRTVSLPWLELLEEWIGTKSEEGIPFTKSNLGEAKGFVKVETETCVDDFGEEFQHVDYRLAMERLPDFFPEDVAQLALDTGKNLRFIRESCPDHPLVMTARPRLPQTLDAPKAEWAFGWDDVFRLEQRVIQYQTELKAIVSDTTKSGWKQLPKPANLCQQQQGNTSIFGLSESEIEQRIASSMRQFSAPIRLHEDDDPFVAILKDSLHSKTPLRRSHDSIAAPHPSLLPILSFGGIISSQAEVINRESLKLLFDSHKLREHLDLQRSFHLLGSGMFCTRLSQALFDPDLETAERQAGVARQGNVMGLRLGSRDTWPPASSELRLALMGILIESYVGDNGPNKRPDGSSIKPDSLPGDLSFAVRDLSPEDIEKCMNPDSLEALDFLRLAYTAPDELRGIITPVVLMQYDRIFKFLVRLLRLMYVVDQLFRTVNLKTNAWEHPGNVAYRFTREARHFVTCIAAYFLDTGIALPWQEFQTKMDQLQAELARDDFDQSRNMCSPETVRDYHSQTVNQIMSALFLRKRQQPILKLLEDIFITVLAYSKHAQLQALGSVEEGGHTRAYAAKLCRDFKKKVQVFITVCRSLTEKTKSGVRDKEGGAHNVGGLGDDSMVAQLLLKLDVNHFYTKS